MDVNLASSPWYFSQNCSYSERAVKNSWLLFNKESWIVDSPLREWAILGIIHIMALREKHRYHEKSKVTRTLIFSSYTTGSAMHGKVLLFGTRSQYYTYVGRLLQSQKLKCTWNYFILQQFVSSNWDVSIGDTEHWVSGYMCYVGIVYLSLIWKSWLYGLREPWLLSTTFFA